MCAKPFNRVKVICQIRVEVVIKNTVHPCKLFKNILNPKKTHSNMSLEHPEKLTAEGLMHVLCVLSSGLESNSLQEFQCISYVFMLVHDNMKAGGPKVMLGIYSNINFITLCKNIRHLNKPAREYGQEVHVEVLFLPKDVQLEVHTQFDLAPEKPSGLRS